MKFSERCRPRTQEQANAWAEEADNYLNGKPSRIKNKRQCDQVLQALDSWIAELRSKYLRPLY